MVNGLYWIVPVAICGLGFLAHILPRNNQDVVLEDPESENVVVTSISRNADHSQWPEQLLFIPQKKLKIKEFHELIVDQSEAQQKFFDYEFVGSVESLDKPLALFRSTQSGKILSLREGATLEGWTLMELDASEAKIKNGKKQKTLELFSRRNP